MNAGAWWLVTPRSRSSDTVKAVAARFADAAPRVDILSLPDDIRLTITVRLVSWATRHSGRAAAPRTTSNGAVHEPDSSPGPVASATGRSNQPARGGHDERPRPRQAPATVGPAGHMANHGRHDRHRRPGCAGGGLAAAHHRPVLPARRLRA